MSSEITSPAVSQDTSVSSALAPLNIAMQDAEFPHNIQEDKCRAVAGYLGGSAANVWSDADFWAIPLTHRRLPIWVGAVAGAARHDPAGDAHSACDRALKLNMLPGRVIALDMETSADHNYVTEFGQVCHNRKFLVWVYASKSNMTLLPPLDGYWMAWYTTETAWPDIPHVVAWQHATDGSRDFSRIRRQRSYRALW
jgi:hypothetical protein